MPPVKAFLSMPLSELTCQVIERVFSSSKINTGMELLDLATSSSIAFKLFNWQAFGHLLETPKGSCNVFNCCGHVRVQSSMQFKGPVLPWPITSCTVGRRSQGIAAFRNLLPRRANPKNAGGCAIRTYGSVCNVHICRRTKATTPTDAAAYHFYDIVHIIACHCLTK